jgi:hypothetical protein
MLEGKRFVFLGEPEHCIIEKYPFRLTFILYLFARGWRHAAMETGRSVGWRVDRYLETGDESFLHVQSSSPQDAALHDRVLEFIDAHENPFHKQLRRLSESRKPDAPRLRYWGYDLDRGVPLASIGPIKSLLQEHVGGRVRDAFRSIDELASLSTDEQLARVGDRFLLPLNDADPQAKAILQNANLRLSWGSYASADLSAQADAVCFVRDVHAE